MAIPQFLVRRRSTLLSAALSALLALPAAAETIIYKGSLVDGGKPAEGQYDLRVQLFSAAVGGNPLTPAITLSGVRVENGRFNATLELAQSLPKQGSVWLEAQLQAPGSNAFVALQGRQEINATLGGTCWETTGNTAVGELNALGVTDSSSTFLALRNDNTNLYLRRNGGVEQGASTAVGPGSAAWGNTSSAFGSNSFAAGYGAVAASHSYTTVFADGSTPSAFTSSAANQFLVRAQGGFAINTNAPLGTLTVRRGGSAGVANPSPSSITAESDGSNYLSLLSPTTAERGILFGDTSSAANGAIVFNPVGAGQTNPSGLTFRTGGNVDRLKITDSGQLLLNQQGDPNADVTFSNAVGGNTDFFMNLRSNTGKLGSIRVGEVSGDFTVQAENGELFLRTNTIGKYIRTNDRLGVSRAPLANMLEVEGNASKTTATAWLANSDRRIKQDIRPLDQALATLRRVQPVSFRYTEAYRAAHPSITDQRYFNVIAQEFAKVFPDAVQPSGEYLPGAEKTAANEILQVDTYPATITTIAAIQELDAANVVQDREVAALKQENAELRKRLEALERLLVTQR